MNISIKEINKKIDEFKKDRAEPQALVMGYKTYSKFMREDKFADQITKDNKDPMIRYYKGIQVKIVTEKHYFELK
ncbi:hypothetical protein [Acinetobacter pragensis]|uniref:Uncharacterized protein n=1 Tax=Acinetobacter pragensis TaxID=1806892 RepID=A0A151XZ38_9GAMM|nr:hypothetical protein [Acinetobacter pragensis]KYQ70914.1 hypothetical protein AZH43_16665 [Acinetobacter pragensis]